MVIGRNLLIVQHLPKDPVGGISWLCILISPGQLSFINGFQGLPTVSIWPSHQFYMSCQAAPTPHTWTSIESHLSTFLIPPTGSGARSNAEIWAAIGAQDLCGLNVGVQVFLVVNTSACWEMDGEQSCFHLHDLLDDLVPSLRSQDIPIPKEFTANLFHDHVLSTDAVLSRYRIVVDSWDGDAMQSNEIHGCNFTCDCVFLGHRLGVGHAGNDLKAVLHGEGENSVVATFGELPNADDVIFTPVDCSGSDSLESFDAELEIPLGLA